METPQWTYIYEETLAILKNEFKLPVPSRDKKNSSCKALISIERKSNVNHERDLHMNMSVNWMFINLTRRIVCREQKQRKEGTGYKDGIEPPMVKIKLDISTQYIRYNYPAKKEQLKMENIYE